MPETTADTKAILAQLKTLTGKEWRDWSHGDQTQFVQYDDIALMRRISQCTDGTWRWRYSAKIGRRYDDQFDLSAEVSGPAVNLEEAATTVMAFVPSEPVSLQGVLWHQHGEDGRIANIDGEEASVSQHDGRFFWQRDWRGLKDLREALPGGSGSGGAFSGFAETFEEAAEAAVTAPAKLKEAVAAWLKGPEPRELPPGAAWAFLDACCGFTDVGSVDGEAVSRPTSQVVRAHLEGALGSAVPNYAAPKLTKHPEYVGRVHAFSDYLEAVAAQLRSDVSADQGE